MKKILLLLIAFVYSFILSAQTTVNADPNNTNNGQIIPGLVFGSNSGEGIASNRQTTTNRYGLDFYTNAANRMCITQAGKVGIGTMTPQQMFSIWGSMNIDQNNVNHGNLNSALTFGSLSGEGIASNRSNGNQFGLDFYTNFINRLSITNTGKVGIGTALPEKQLSITGGMNIDQSNLNNGALNSSTLTFGSASGEGIGSNRSSGGINPWGLDFYAGGNNRMVITNSGNVGIGTNAPGMRLTVNGNILAYGTVTPSDIYYKKNIVPVSNALKKLMSISGYYYSFKTNEFPDMGFDTKNQIGVIAQEVEKVLPEVVTTLQNGYKAVDYPKMIPLLIEGMKEQQQMIEKQQTQIDELQKIVVALIKK